MEIQRTANAGVLLKMDGVSILLDGFCSRVDPYLPTPDGIRDTLMRNPPDILAFTHRHADHYDPALVSTYSQKTLRPILGPENLANATVFGEFSLGNVTITPVPSRHLGKVEPDLQHVSYIIRGSQCIWFLGDASPSQWQGRSELPRPDVMIAPYAYALTKAAWRQTCALTEHVVLLHMPERSHDPYGLWPMVESVTENSGKDRLQIPEIGQTIFF